MTKKKVKIGDLPPEEKKEWQRLAREWKQDNKERNRYLSYKATAKLFARKYATAEDMEEVIEIYKTQNPNYKESK